MRPDNLNSYRAKRDFGKTPEPHGATSDHDDGPIFVIQKHDASSLHYDFRLEVEGLLKSWAIPKGPSTNPRDKRLAIQTEDHPFEYATFEGNIPEDQYGGGTVIVWDTGRYRNLMAEKDDPLSMNRSLEVGHVEVWLEGSKLKGGYALVRLKGESRQWLLVKMKDDHADARRNPVSTEPDSVLTGRSIEQVRADR